MGTRVWFGLYSVLFYGTTYVEAKSLWQHQRNGHEKEKNTRKGKEKKGEERKEKKRKEKGTQEDKTPPKLPGLKNIPPL